MDIWDFIFGLIFGGLFTGGVWAAFKLMYILIDALVILVGFDLEIRFKKTFSLALTIIVAGAMMLSGFAEELKLSLFGWCVGVIIISYLAYTFMKGDSVVCPNCGAWNEYETEDHLGTSTKEVWETHDRAIRDSDYKKIGTYESRELHTYTTSTNRLRCTSCGKIFIKSFTY